MLRRQNDYEESRLEFRPCVTGYADVAIRR